MAMHLTTLLAVLLNRVDTTQHLSGYLTGNDRTAALAALDASMQLRQDRTHNMKFDATYRKNNHHYKNGHVGEVSIKLNGENIKHYKLNKSYLSISQRGGLDVSKASQTIYNHFDSKSGVNTTYAELISRGPVGRIDSVEGSAVSDNFYLSWIGGEDFIEQKGQVGEGVNWIKYILKHSNTASEVALQDNILTVTMPWVLNWSKITVGELRFRFDVHKQHMPTLIAGRWDRKDAHGTVTYWSEESTVLDSSAIDGLYLPTKIRQLATASSLGPDLVTVTDVTISNISLGTVADDDLRVVFTEGTEVIDALKGVAYTIGSDGKKLNIQPLVKTAPAPVDHKLIPTTTDIRRRKFLLLFSLIGFAAIAALMTWYRFRKS